MIRMKVNSQVFILFFLLISSLSWPVNSLGSKKPGIPKAMGLVNDFADVIPLSYERKIGAVADELRRKTGTTLVVVTIPDIGDEDYNEYANRLYNVWGIGKKGEDRGVLIFVAVKERKIRIETGYGVEGILPDGLVGHVRDRYIVPYLKHDRFGEGLLMGTIALSKIIARDAGVELTGQVRKDIPRKGAGKLSILPVILIIVFFMFASRRRGGLFFLLPLFLGSGMGTARYGGGFDGFSGGFGGFGGGMSGGGGAGGSF